MKQDQEISFYKPAEEETIESLKKKLKEAEDRIELLRQALGPNHPLGIRRNIFL